jgi:hypothetical protein
VYIRRLGPGLLLNAVYHVRMKTLVLGLLLGIVRVTYLPGAPGTAARWGALSSLVGGLLGATTFVPYFVPYLSRGNVEATDPLTTGQVSSGSLHALALATVLSILGIVGLYGTLVAHSGRPDALAVSGASLAALSAASLLALFAYTIAGSLGWLYPLQEIGMGAYALGLLLVGTSAFRARLFGRLRALPLVVASLWPASIGLLLLWDRSGMVLRTELIIGALPFLGAALLGLVMLTYYRPGSGSIGPGEAD